MSANLASPEWTARLSPKPEHELSKVRQLYLALYEAIATGDLYCGLRLPSSRILSEQLSLGRNTVIAAYAQLEAEGLIESRGRNGTCVIYSATSQNSSKEANNSPPIATNLSARACNDIEPVITFVDLAPGMPDPSLFPADSWRRAMQKAARLPTSQLGYEDKPLPQLQQAIARHLSIYRSLHVEPDRILITSSTRQSLLVAANLYANVGDHAWVETPGYLGAVEAFILAGLKLNSMPVDQNGAVVDTVAQGAPPALIYLTPCFHYPSGAPLSMHRRQTLLEYASANGVTIFEDDYDSEFRDSSEARPALAAQAPFLSNPSNAGSGSLATESKETGYSANVLHAGTFSKLIFPAARLAWLVLPRDHMISAQKCLKSIGGGHNRIAQATVSELLHNGSVARHLQSARRVYTQRRQHLIKSLNDTQWFLPFKDDGGSLSLVVKLRQSVPLKRLSQGIIEQRIGAQPMCRFEWDKPDNDHVDTLVLGIGNLNSMEIPGAVARLVNVLDESVK